VLVGLNRLTDPLYRRLDDFVRVVIAAFFVANLRGRRACT
jgi:hypothetical protein